MAMWSWMEKERGTSLERTVREEPWRKSQLSQEVKEKEPAVEGHGKSMTSGGNSNFKDPEAGTNIACFRSRKGLHVVGGEWEAEWEIRQSEKGEVTCDLVICTVYGLQNLLLVHRGEMCLDLCFRINILLYREGVQEASLWLCRV